MVGGEHGINEVRIRPKLALKRGTRHAYLRTILARGLLYTRCFSTSNKGYPMRISSLLSALTAAFTLAVVSAPAFAQTAIKFNLGWRVEASGAGFLIAQQKGYYKAEGLDVTIDTGNGSAGAVTAVAGGAYDAASADIATLVEFNAANPTRRLIATMIQYDGNPNSIIVKKSSGITKPADLAGKKIVAQPFNASRKLYPIFASATKTDPKAINWQSIDPAVGDQSFIKGDADGVAFFFFTGLINLEGKGVKPEELTVFKFSDFGVQTYGNAIVMNPKIVRENPNAVRGFVRATIRGWLDAIQNPVEGAKAVKTREPLADEALELKRLRMIAEGSMITAATLRDGYGGATEARIQATINEVSAALEIKTPLAIADVWDGSFLPPREQRMIRR
jgi:NitT/TauT family transport system substrate-binding protein